MSFRDVSKRAADGSCAVTGVNLDVAPGETVVLLGPAGSGKSTLLQLAAGATAPSAGAVLLDGRPVVDVLSQDRPLAMVTPQQNFYPRLDVGENIALPLTMSGLGAGEQQRRVAAVAGRFGVTPLLRSRPRELSAVDLRRVALCRAMICRPRLLLLDEPLSGMDARARDELRPVVAEQIRELGATVLYAAAGVDTAPQEADRIVVLRAGRIRDVGTPGGLWADPGTVFTAAALGDPPMNLVEASVHVELEEFVALGVGTRYLRLPWNDIRSRAIAHYHGERLVLGVRPEAVRPGRPGSALQGRVLTVEHRAGGTYARLDIGAGAVDTGPPPVDRPVVGPRRGWFGRPGGGRGIATAVSDTVLPPLDQPTRSAEFVVRLPPGNGIAPGRTMPIGFTLGDIHLFDDRGLRIDLGRGVPGPPALHL
ncbi:ABC transporter ATP-binding protein [Pseudonocardia sp. NPDC046786]|uniref:ABC transporter ATP-binding protein n=1 Tax=Pseudonocardia sp. NPDC046786 TaxID=3155471 RepID=UPI0033CCD93E